MSSIWRVLPFHLGEYYPSTLGNSEQGGWASVYDGTGSGLVALVLIEHLGIAGLSHHGWGNEPESSQEGTSSLSSLQA